VIKVREEPGHLITSKLLAQHRSAALIYRVHLEQVLCQVDANSRNLHGGRLCSAEMPSGRHCNSWARGSEPNAVAR
jgi:hypothetical protein